MSNVRTKRKLRQLQGQVALQHALLLTTCGLGALVFPSIGERMGANVSEHANSDAASDVAPFRPILVSSALAANEGTELPQGWGDMPAYLIDRPDTPAAAKGRIRAFADALREGNLSSSSYASLLEYIERAKLGDREVEAVAASLIAELRKDDYDFGQDAFRELMHSLLFLGYDPRLVLELKGQLGRELKLSLGRVPEAIQLMAQCQSLGIGDCEQALSTYVNRIVEDARGGIANFLDSIWRLFGVKTRQVFTKPASGYIAREAASRMAQALEAHNLKYGEFDFSGYDEMNSQQFSTWLGDFDQVGLGRSPRASHGSTYPSAWWERSVDFLRDAGIADHVAEIAGRYDRKHYPWSPYFAALLKEDADWTIHAAEAEGKGWFAHAPLVMQLSHAIAASGSVNGFDAAYFIETYQAPPK